jgi:hypothetical protein
MSETGVVNHANHFLSFAVVLQRNSFHDFSSAEYRCESSISYLGLDHRLTQFRKLNHPIRFTFHAGNPFSDSVIIFSTREVNDTSYTFLFRLFSGRSSDLKSVQIVLQIGNAAMTHFIQFFTFGFLLGGLFIALFFIEAQYFSLKSPNWSSELKASLFLVIFFEFSLYGNNFHFHHLFDFVFKFVTRLIWSLDLKCSILFFVFSVRRTESWAKRNQIRFLIIIGLIITGNCAVEGFMTVSQSAFDELSNVKLAMKYETVIEIVFLVFVFVNLRESWWLVDESERHRFFIYAYLIGVVQIPVILGRFAQGFWLPVGDILILRSCHYYRTISFCLLGHVLSLALECSWS